MVRYRNSPRLLMPLPRHMFAPDVEAAREAIQARYAGRLSREFLAQPIAREHARSRPWPGVLVSSGARSLASVATAAGFEVRVDETEQGCVVSGHRDDPRCGFRAEWSRGKTAGATWHEPLRYQMIEDRRAVAMDERNRVGRVGHRTSGQGAWRLSLVATPLGLPLGVTALRERLSRFTASPGGLPSPHV